MSETVASTGGADPLQFDRAEYTAPRNVSCQSCKTAIRDIYYTANGVVLCPDCREKLGDGRPPLTFASVLKASWFGFLAAVLGAVIWGGIRSATGMNLGIVAVVVGVLIGRAVRKNGGHAGGWVFQLIAVLMTYVCIALSLIPEVLKELPVKPDLELAGLIIHWVVVIAMVVASPILSSFDILGLLINGFAFYEAWKLNKRMPIRFTGPLQINPGVYAPAQPIEVAAGG